MSDSTLKPAIFLDRDGVIVENRADYVKTIEEIQIIPGVLPALARAAALEALIVVVSNQSPVGRGILAWPMLAAINAHIQAAVVAAGGRIDGWYICPHQPEDNCTCRKPKPGLLLTAAAELPIDLPASVMVGDALSDVLAGRAASARSIMVRTGRGAGQIASLRQAGLADVPVVADLAAALELIAAIGSLT